MRMIGIMNTLSRLFGTRRKHKLQVLFSFEVEVEGREKPIKIQVVEDQPCPYCGAIFPNRPKVHDKKGWWWRCYTEDCVVRYYQPEHMLVELRGTGETISYEELWRLFERGG